MTRNNKLSSRTASLGNNFDTKISEVSGTKIFAELEQQAQSYFAKKHLIDVAISQVIHCASEQVVNSSTNNTPKEVTKHNAEYNDTNEIAQVYCNHFDYKESVLSIFFSDAITRIMVISHVTTLIDILRESDQFSSLSSIDLKINPDRKSSKVL